MRLLALHRLCLLALTLATLAASLPAPLLHAVSDCCHAHGGGPSEGASFSDECPGCEAGTGSALLPFSLLLEARIAASAPALAANQQAMPQALRKALRDRAPPACA